MPERHALLGPSSAHRWLACPPSARLEEKIPNESSKYADEGTMAHALAADKLNSLITGQEIIKGDYDPEMWDCTDQYKDFVEEEWNAVKAETPDAKLLIEQEIEFGEYVPGGFGTSDAVIVSDTVLKVIDFKYGKGVPVDAKDNPQLRLYALGSLIALGDLFDFDRIEMYIFQPRLHSATADATNRNSIKSWAEDYLKPRAEQADKGEGEFCVGDHCRFCRAGSVCRARAEVAFGVIEKSSTPKELIGDEEIDAILDKLDTTEAWIDSIRAYALSRALNGYSWSGYKLVESRTQRKITDPIKALERMEQAGFDKEDVTTLKLKGLTELEKTLTKKRFNELLGDLVEKPTGQPTLVKESDRRPAINPIELAFKEE